jgi:ribonuclease PH
MRSDQREAGQVRPVTITPNYLMTAEGSAMIEVGHTKVLCAASLDDAVPQFLRNSGRGWVTAEYSMLPRATATRTPREISKGKPSGRSQEIQRLIGRSLRAVMDLDALGERVIVVDCDVLQADGGTRTAAITGGYVALALAVRRLLEFGVIRRNPLRDQVAALSVGVVGGETRLDLNYEEDSQADVDMNVVMTGSGEFVEIQATGERTSFGDDRLSEMLSLARQAMTHLFDAQREAMEVR